MVLDLKKVKVSKAEEKRYFDMMSNWDDLHHRLKDWPGGGPSLAALEKMLKVEASTRRRLTLATRLLGLYHNVARRENESVLLNAMAKRD